MDNDKEKENKSKDSIRERIQNLSISLDKKSIYPQASPENPTQTPLDTPSKSANSSQRRTVLILRDLPPSATREKILTLLSSPGSSHVRVLSAARAFGDDWELRFESEAKCVEAALLLRNKQLDGEKVHCRVKNVLDAEECENGGAFRRGGFRASPAISSCPPIRISSGTPCSPLYYRTPSSVFTPIASPVTDDSILEQIRVPDGVFGESPLNNCIAVSPMSPILETPTKKSIDKSFVPPNFYDFSRAPKSDSIHTKYRQILDTRQNKLKTPVQFPKNMVKSLGKNSMRRLLAQLAEKKFERPSSFLTCDGLLMPYAREVPVREVLYGQELPLSNPNNGL